MSVALATVGMLKLSATPIAAVFAIQVAADQILGVLVVGTPWLLERHTTGDDDLHRGQVKSAGENVVGPPTEATQPAETPKPA